MPAGALALPAPAEEAQCVAEGARRRGVARALLAALIAELEALNPPCSTLELHMLEGNAAAAQLYASLGFVKGARHENYYIFGGTYHHAVHWRRELPPLMPPAGAAPGAGGAAEATQELATAAELPGEGGKGSVTV